MILVGDIMAKVPVTLLDPATVQRVEPAQLHDRGKILARRFQRLEHMGGLVGR